MQNPTLEQRAKTRVGCGSGAGKKWWIEMDSRTTELERAFQMAESGECRSTDEIRKRLVREGYYGSQVTGKTLQRQLQQIITAALKAKSAALERTVGVHTTGSAGGLSNGGN